jgi:hypothetical protein
MGLLDNISEDQLIGGLLGAGAASGARGNFLSRLAAGMGAGEKFSQGRQEQARQRSQDEMQAEYKQLMMRKMQMEAEREQRAQTQGQANTAAVRNSLGDFDPAQFLQRNPEADIAGLEQAIKLRQLTQPKASKFSTAPQYDQQGRAFILADDGSMKYLDGVKARDKLLDVDLGGKKGFRTEYSPEMVGMADKFQTPDSIASNEISRRGQDITMRGQNMTDSRARELNAISGGAKAPAGYRFKPDGSLEAIQGGPADIKAGELGAKAEARRQSQAAQAASVLDTIGEAKNLVGITTAGFGALAAGVPATEARNLSAKLETIKANLGFDRLQQMREQSPTGGALGAVAVQELTALQSTVSSLDQKQSPTQLKASLAKIEQHYKRWQETVKSAGGGASGGKASGWSIQKE